MTITPIPQTTPHGHGRFTRFDREKCPHCGRKNDGCIIFESGWIICLHTEGVKASDKGLGGWWHLPLDDTATASSRTLWVDPTWTAPREAARTAVAQPHQAEKADTDTCHAVYSDLFKLCPLTAAHRAKLVGFTDAQASRYGSLPPQGSAGQRRVLDALIEKYGWPTLATVPGFALGESKETVIRGGGLILPARDVQGHIAAVDVRRDPVPAGEAKYYKLSSRTVGGPGPGSPAHVAIPAGGVTDHSTVLLVEGIKKADYAADATGYVVISIPGVACTASAQSALEALAGDVAIVALDRDDPTKERTVADVAHAREALARLAISLGYGVRIAYWDNADGKGLDDLLIGGKTYTLARYGGSAVNGEGSRIGTQTELLGRIVEIVHNHSVNHKHKLGLIASFIALYEAEQDPRQQPDELGCYRILTCRMADEMGVSANTASTTLRELAGPDYGYLRHHHTKDPEDGKTITYLGLGPKRLGAKDKVPEPPHLAKERERKRRCPRCRSGALEPASFVCTDCGHVCTIKEAEAAAQATVVTADGRLADKHTGEVFTTPQGPPTESVGGGEPTAATTTAYSPDIGPPDFVGGPPTNDGPPTDSVGGPPTTVPGASRHTVTVHESVAGPDGGPFPVIYADPPWRYLERTASPNRIVENHYATMALEDICALPIPQWAAPNAVLFLWSPAPKLEEAFQVMKAWGFGYKTSMAWVKDRIGMGYWVRQQHELLLIGRRGAMPAPPPSVRVPSVVYAPRREHSRKPDELYSIIEQMYPDVPKLELFARTRRPGWTAHGNEVDRFAADGGDEGVRGPHRERASASRRPLRSR